MKQMMTPQEMERRLGQQYAQTLKESPRFTDEYRDCQDVINASLSFLEHYNKISLALRRQLSAAQTAGVFS